jgi:glycine oxidase
VTAEKNDWTIIGQGLAGTCLAWALWKRGEAFRVIDRGTGGSSRVAGGMVNPITGKNFEPSWRIGEFLPEALEFYRWVEGQIGQKVWHLFPVLRLAGSDREWQKICSKLGDPSVVPWVSGEVAVTDEWTGAVEVKGGGRLDTLAFMDGSRRFFEELGCYERADFCAASDCTTIWCEGAEGLMSGQLGAHRCAKGEILTVKASDWDETCIRIGAGGWLVPIGGGLFKIGSTYEWVELNDDPTEKGRQRVEEIAGKLGGSNFEVIAHEAGVRPIMRRSQPMIGPRPQGGWMFNGLGSKGSLYAPSVADRLAKWLIDGIEPDSDLDVREFLKQQALDVSH